MISREEAIDKLKEFWQTDKFVFQAVFHVPKKVILREGSKPFGYFRNIRLNGEFIEYPIDANEKRISIYHIIKGGLEDGKRYEVELTLSKDKHRSKNPYSMKVKRFKPLESTVANTDTGLEKTIKEIFNENININSPFNAVYLANSVESLATDIYSEDKRFIYELIQNADDAALNEDSELSIDILKDYVVISHNGAPFSSRDMRGLCGIGVGNKTSDANKTGYKGIGFKSVFGQREGVVYVKTENTLFRFDREFAKQKGWNSKWGKQTVWEKKNGIVFKCPWQMMPILSRTTNDKATDTILSSKKYSVKTAIKINDSQTLYNNINSFFGDAKFLLFLRRISKVTLTFNEHNLILEKFKNPAIENMVTLQGNQQNISNWYVKNWVHDIPKDIQSELKSDPKTPEKIQEMKKTEISFAINVNASFDKIKLLEEETSPLYSYLPTTVKEYNIPFIVNCNFLLDASREKIHKNRKWNEWLFKVIGYKTVECSSEFLANNLFESDYLSIFRNGIVTETDNLREKINEGIRIGLEKFPIVRDRNSNLRKLKEVVLDPFDLHKVDGSLPETFASFFNTTQENYQIKGSSLISLSGRNKILNKLGATIITEDQLQDYLSTKYVSSFITKDNNAVFLDFLRPFEINDPSGKWYTAVTNNKLILNQYGELDSIRKVCFPIAIDTANEFKNMLINSEVYKLIEPNKILIDWLEKLGVTDPGSLAYLEKEIISSIDTCINAENYLNITKFIFDLHTDNKLTDEHYVDLQELPLKTSRGFKKANQTVLSLAFNPTTDFNKVLPNEAYLKEDYLELSSPQECKLFFKQLNVIDDIEFIKSSKKLSSELPEEYVNTSNNFAKDGHNYPYLIGKFTPNLPNYEVSYYLQSFSFLEHSNKLGFSILFWERIFNKYHLALNSTGTSPRNYCPGREFTIYNLGQGLTISSLDEMNWGRYLGNKTKVPSFIFWFFQNVRCIPTCTGLKLAKDTFTNSEDIKDMAGEYLPVIKINRAVPTDWCEQLGLKTKFSLSDLLSILAKVSFSLRSKGFLNKEDEKRVGLIYNELITRLEINYNDTQRTISDWVVNNELISTSKKNIRSENLIYINISGFGDSMNGIETIFIPRNVDTKHPFFEKFLSAFRVKIIDKFSYQAENEQVFYDLQIKLLKLIGPITLMLKNKMLIQDFDRSLYERFLKISKIEFLKCNNIRPVFEHESEEIEGEAVKYHYDKVQNSFLISENWKRPNVILLISYILSKLLSAVRLEKEIMMMLNMDDYLIVDYLRSIDIEIEEYNTSEIALEISKLIKELEDKTIVKTITPKSSLIDNTSNETIQKEEVNGEALNNHKLKEEIPIEDEKEDQYRENEIPYTENELEELQALFGRELTESELEQENLFAQLKALRYLKDNAFNVAEAEVQFKDNYKDRYLYPVVDAEGNRLKIMCRSARKGVLFLGAYPWKQLERDDTQLFILTGIQSDDCLWFETNQELEEELNSEYKILRKHHSNFEEIKSIIDVEDAEGNLANLELLYKVKQSSIDFIFDPQMNEVGDSEGPLLDIGVDI